MARLHPFGPHCPPSLTQVVCVRTHSHSHGARTGILRSPCVAAKALAGFADADRPGVAALIWAAVGLKRSTARVTPNRCAPAGHVSTRSFPPAAPGHPGAPGRPVRKLLEVRPCAADATGRNTVVEREPGLLPAELADGPRVDPLAAAGRLARRA